MLNTKKIEFLKKNNHELRAANADLIKENRRLKEELKDCGAVLRAAQAYKDEHAKALLALDAAKQQYLTAVHELMKQKAVYDREFKDLLKQI